MNIVYADGASTDESNPTEITPKEKLLDPPTYLCPSCIRPAFTIKSEVHARLFAAQQEKEMNKLKNFYTLMQQQQQQQSQGASIDSPKRPIGGAHLIASATDRARQLGLIGSGGSGPGSTTSSKSVTYPSTDERIKMVSIENIAPPPLCRPPRFWGEIACPIKTVLWVRHLRI